MPIDLIDWPEYRTNLVWLGNSFAWGASLLLSFMLIISQVAPESGISEIPHSI